MGDEERAPTEPTPPSTVSELSELSEPQSAPPSTEERPKNVGTPRKRRGVGRNARLRAEARLQYIVNPRCSTLDKLALHPMFAGQVGLATLRKWRELDGWDKERDEYYAEWMGRVKQRLGNQLSKTREKELDAIERLYADGLAMLLPDPNDPNAKPKLLPKSWDSAVRSLVILGERREKLTDAVVQTFSPETKPDEGLPEMSAEEQELLIAQLLASRRAEVRKTLYVAVPPPMLIETATPAEASPSAPEAIDVPVSIPSGDLSPVVIEVPVEPKPKRSFTPPTIDEPPA